MQTLLLSLPSPGHAHLAGTLLPRGFFLGLGLIYLAALALDRLAERLKLPAAAAILLLGLALPSDILAQAQPVGPLQVETIHRVSLALLIFYAGLGTNLRRIRGMVAAGLQLGTVGGLITFLITGLALLLLGPSLAEGLPVAAVWLAACCLVPTDSGALEDVLVSLGPRLNGRLTHLLQFETALSTLTALLGFGFLAGVFQAHSHGEHQALHGAIAATVTAQLGALALHLLAGLAAGALVGVLAPRLIDTLVRSEQKLLLVAISLAFVAYGLGQLLGGGGLIAVFAAGVCLANGEATSRFEPHALERVMHPFNTAAELTVLLLLGLLVKPSELVSMLPLAILLALVLPLARLAAVWAVLPGRSFPRRDRLMVAGCGLRSAVPLALAVSLVEELPHLHGLTAAAAEALAPRLLALIYGVVLFDLLLQSVLMRGRHQWPQTTVTP
jgi:cell volume regulation protein A